VWTAKPQAEPCIVSNPALPQQANDPTMTDGLVCVVARQAHLVVSPALASPGVGIVFSSGIVLLANEQ